MLEQIDLQQLIAISKAAGDAILEIYKLPFDPTIEKKADNSPLTIADRAANEVIMKGLEKYYPQIPIISEENKLTSYDERKGWACCWLVDPLDGTKEFIKKNGEFTVNIALIMNGKPVVGVIYVPVQDTYYFAKAGEGSFKQVGGNEAKRIHVRDIDPNEPVIIVASRSHLNADTENYINEQKAKYDRVELTSVGSSLKFCYVAEGKAHLYPRFAPTMEWDTGAAQAIVMEAGGKVTVQPEGVPLSYNRENLLNPYFLVEAV